MEKKRKWIIVILVVIIAAVVLSYRYYFNNTSSTSQQTIDPRMLLGVKNSNIEKTIAAEGFIEPVDEEDLSFPSKSSGSFKVKKIYVKEGEGVEKGQLLMELDETEARLNYLEKENAYKRSQINGSKNDIEEAKLNLELASFELDNLDLKAPFAGIITSIDIEEGSYYSSGDVATIKDTSRLQIKVDIEESNIPIVELGQEVRVTLNSLPDKELKGKVVELGDEADNDSSIVTLPVTVLLDKVDFDIKLGVSAELDIIVAQVKGQVVIPITAIFTENGEDFVMKYQDDKLEKTAVETGLSSGMRIAILSGLKTGDRILVNTFKQSLELSSETEEDMEDPRGGRGGFGGPGMMGGGRP